MPPSTSPQETKSAVATSGPALNPPRTVATISAISTEEYHTPRAVMEAIDRRTKIVTAVCTSDGSKWGPYTASGGVLATGWVLTNAHAVAAEEIRWTIAEEKHGKAIRQGKHSLESLKIPRISVTGITVYFENGSFVSAQLAATVLGDDDLALLQVKTPSMEPVPLYQYRPRVFQEIFYAGYPGMNEVVAAGRIVGVRPGVITESVVPAGSGMSGGPLYTMDGRLIGVQVRWQPSSGASFATAIDRLKQFFRDTQDIHQINFPADVKALAPRVLIDAPPQQSADNPCTAVKAPKQN